MKICSLPLFLGCCLLLIGQACQDTYPGYDSVKGEGHYRMEDIGESSKRPKTGDHLKLRIWSVDKDSARLVLYEADVAKGYQNSWWRILKRLSPGDSASLILPPGQGPEKREGWLATISKEDTLRLSILLQDLYTEEEWKAHLEKEQWKTDEEMNEQIRLSAYLKENQVDAETRIGGMYYLPVSEGKGRIVQAGDHVSVHYRSMYLDSTEFDNSREAGTPLEFILGKPDQVLPGFELGIRKMRVGGKAVFILPSQLGYGEFGSTTGLVPPYTTLIYEVELIQVK